MSSGSERGLLFEVPLGGMSTISLRLSSPLLFQARPSLLEGEREKVGRQSGSEMGLWADDYSNIYL